jgi:hypothetical protein
MKSMTGRSWPVNVAGCSGTQVTVLADPEHGVEAGQFHDSQHIIAATKSGIAANIRRTTAKRLRRC